ncbi:MAG: hypothetical protein ACI3Y2_01895 [Candidatus Egerieousia sp.]
MPTKKLYPLQFVDKEDLCIDYENLTTEQAKEAEESLKLGNNCTEKSFVAKGFLAGNTLEDIVDTYLGNILGEKAFRYFEGLFPLEVKILSYKKRTPVIVTADEETARSRFGCMGKEKLWYILSAKKGSSIYLGFRNDISAQEIYDCQLKGEILPMMNEIEPEAGETFYIKPGTPMSIGSGVEIIEVSQNSPIELNIEDNDQLVEALDFINLSGYIPEYFAPEECPFRVERINISDEQKIDTEETGSFIIFLCLSGRAHIRWKDGELSLTKKDMTLIPNELEFSIAPDEKSDATLLKIYPAPISDDLDDHVHHHDDGHDCDCGEDHHHCDCGGHHHHGE